MVGLEGKPTRTSRRKRITITPRFLVFMLVVMVAYVGAGFVQRQITLAGIHARIRETKSELAAMEARNKELEETIKRLQSDEFVEKTAREKLNLVKPGEQVYVVSDKMNPKDPFYVKRRPEVDSDPAGY